MNTLHADDYTLIINRIRQHSTTMPDAANAVAKTLVDEHMKPVREASQDAENLINFAQRRGQQAARVLHRASRKLKLITLLPGRLQQYALRKMASGMVDRCEDLKRDIGTFTSAFSGVALHSVAQATEQAVTGERALADAAADYRAGRVDDRCWKILSDGAHQLDDLIRVLKMQEGLLSVIQGSYTNVARQLETAATALRDLERANGRIEDLQGQQRSLKDMSIQASLLQARLEFIRIQTVFTRERGKGVSSA